MRITDFMKRLFQKSGKKNENSDLLDRINLSMNLLVQKSQNLNSQFDEEKKQIAELAEEAKKLGNSKVSNLVVLGMAARHMDFTKEQWYSVIEHTVPPKTIEVNKAAFDAGYGA